MVTHSFICKACDLMRRWMYLTFVFFTQLRRWMKEGASSQISLYLFSPFLRWSWLSSFFCLPTITIKKTDANASTEQTEENVTERKRDERSDVSVTGVRNASGSWPPHHQKGPEQ